LKHQGDNCESVCREIICGDDEKNREQQAFPPLSGLSDWCLEVDAALGLPFPEDLNGMENQLQNARSRANEIDSDLVSAKARIKSDLNDLEHLLSECTAIQQQIAAEAC